MGLLQLHAAAPFTQPFDVLLKLVGSNWAALVARRGAAAALHWMQEHPAGAEAAAAALPAMLLEVLAADPASMPLVDVPLLAPPPPDAMPLLLVLWQSLPPQLTCASVAALPARCWESLLTNAAAGLSEEYNAQCTPTVVTAVVRWLQEFAVTALAGAPGADTVAAVRAWAPLALSDLHTLPTAEALWHTGYRACWHLHTLCSTAQALGMVWGALAEAEAAGRPPALEAMLAGSVERAMEVPGPLAEALSQDAAAAPRLHQHLARFKLSAIPRYDSDADADHELSDDEDEEEEDGDGEGGAAAAGGGSGAFGTGGGAFGTGDAAAGGGW